MDEQQEMFIFLSYRPNKLIKASFLHKDTIGFALFLAFYSGGFKAVNCLLR